MNTAAEIRELLAAVEETIGGADIEDADRLVLALRRRGLAIVALDNHEPHTVHVFEPGATTCSSPGCTKEATTFIREDDPSRSIRNVVGSPYWDET